LDYETVAERKRSSIENAPGYKPPSQTGRKIMNIILVVVPIFLLIHVFIFPVNIDIQREYTAMMASAQSPANTQEVRVFVSGNYRFHPFRVNRFAGTMYIEGIASAGIVQIDVGYGYDSGSFRYFGSGESESVVQGDIIANFMLRDIDMLLFLGATPAEIEAGNAFQSIFIAASYEREIGQEEFSARLQEK